MTEREVYENLQEMECLKERWKNSYLWNTDFGNEKSREHTEKKNCVPLTEWEESGHTYTAEWSVSLSRKNAYINAYYTKDGKQTTWRAISASMKRLEKAIYNKDGV